MIFNQRLTFQELQLNGRTPSHALNVDKPVVNDSKTTSPVTSLLTEQHSYLQTRSHSGIYCEKQINWKYKPLINKFN